MAVLAVTSCDKSKQQADDNQPATAQSAASATKIAFVEVDSIMTQYKFCKDYSLILQKKGQNIQNTLAAKQQQRGCGKANSSRSCGRMPTPVNRHRAYRCRCRSRTTTCNNSTSVLAASSGRD